MGKTVQAILGLSLLGVLYAGARRYHNNYECDQVGRKIEKQTKGALELVQATSPFLDDSYLEGIVTVKEISCHPIPTKQNYHYCTMSFVEFEEPLLGTKVYAHVQDYQLGEFFSATISGMEELSVIYQLHQWNQNLEFMEILCAKTEQRKVYIRAIPENESTSLLQLEHAFVK